mgnify:CR=1 FL=1
MNCMTIPTEKCSRNRTTRRGVEAFLFDVSWLCETRIIPRDCPPCERTDVYREASERCEALLESVSPVESAYAAGPNEGPCVGLFRRDGAWLSIVGNYRTITV